MDMQPSAPQQELMTRVGELARARFAPCAATYDLEASCPIEHDADLRQAGLLALCIPERYGGMGADYETYCFSAALTVAAGGGRSCSDVWSTVCCTFGLPGASTGTFPVVCTSLFAEEPWAQPRGTAQG